MPESAPELQAKTLLAHLSERSARVVDERVFKTFQRRSRQWRVAERVALMAQGVKAGDAGVFFLEATDRAFDGGGGFETALFDAFAQGIDVFKEAGLGSREHGNFFLTTLGTAAEDERSIRVIRVGNGFDFDGSRGIASGDQFEPTGFKPPQSACWSRRRAQCCVAG